MTSTPPVQAGSTKAAKPSLGGVAIKTRKRTQVATAKFEPLTFRDELCKSLNTLPPNSSEDAHLRVLESIASAGEVDIRRYDVPLLELLILGRLLAPGGSLIAGDGSEPLAFSILHRQEGQGVKGVVDVISRYIRRFKYLQKPLEETVLPGILQNVNRLDTLPSGLTVPGTASAPASGATTPVSGPTAASNLLASVPRPNLERLASAIAMMVSTNQAPPSIVQSVRKEHLIKDGSALAFLAAYIKAFLSLETSGGPENTIHALRKGGATDLLAYFPASKRSSSELQSELGKEKLGKGAEKVVEWQLKIQESLKKEEILGRIRNLMGVGSDEDHHQDRASDQEIVSYLSQAQKSTSLSADDFISLILTGLLAGISAPEDGGDMPTSTLLPYIKSISDILGHFASNPRSEIALINAIQVHSYTHSNLLPLAQFPKVLQTLYNEDTLSSQAIFYWHEKGAKPQGKENYRKASEPLVKAIKESEDSDEEDDE